MNNPDSLTRVTLLGIVEQKGGIYRKHADIGDPPPYQQQQRLTLTIPVHGES